MPEPTVKGPELRWSFGTWSRAPAANRAGARPGRRGRRQELRPRPVRAGQCVVTRLARAAPPLGEPPLCPAGASAPWRPRRSNPDRDRPPVVEPLPPGKKPLDPPVISEEGSQAQLSLPSTARKRSTPARRRATA